MTEDAEISPALILIQATREKSPWVRLRTRPMFTNPLESLFNLMAFPEIPPETNEAPDGDNVPGKLPAESCAVTPSASSNFQWAMALAMGTLAKFAVTVLLPVMVRTRGLALPVTSPVQPVNTNRS